MLVIIFNDISNDNIISTIKYNSKQGLIIYIRA